MKLRIFTTTLSLIVHLMIILILISIPTLEQKQTRIKIEPILVYIPKSPLLGTPPIYIPEKEEGKNQESTKPKEESKKDVKKKEDTPLLIRKGDKEQNIQQKNEVSKSENIEKEEMKKGDVSQDKSSFVSPTLPPSDSKSKSKYIYSEGIGRPKLNYPSGFYFKGGEGGTGGEGIQGFAGSAYFDSGGYDITPWAKEVIEKVKRNWLVPIAAKYGIQGITGLYLVFERDGKVSSLSLTRKSGVISFDQAASNAVISSIPFPKLPSDFPKENLPAYFFFYYNLPVGKE